MSLFRSREEKEAEEKAEQERKLAGFNYYYIGRFGECYVCKVCSAFVRDWKKHRERCKR